MPVKTMEGFGRKLLAWTFSLGLGLLLLALLVATGHSIRRAEITEAVEPELPLQHAQVDNTHHPSGLAGWMTP